MATYGYARVSTAEQAADDRTSLDNQRRKIEGIAAAADWTLDRIFVEEGASGSVPLHKRPQGGELWALLEPGDRLIAARLDRLFRSATDALTVSDSLAERKIALVLLDIGIEPVNGSAAGKLYFSVLAAMAEFERGRIRERQEESLIARRAQGLHLGGFVPFGFTVEGEKRAARLVPNPAEQRAIATMRELRARKQSLRKIQAAVLQEHGFAVSPMTVRAALARAERAS